jgi:hypothetical protein
VSLRSPSKVIIDSAYYTDDDGKSFFKDTIYCVPPFQHDGKTAVRAMVFTYANGTKEYVAYEMRYTAEWQKKLDAACAQAAKDGKPASSVPEFFSRDLADRGWEVRVPGSDGKWISRNDPQALTAMNNPSPDGSPREADVP